MAAAQLRRAFHAKFERFSASLQSSWRLQRRALVRRARYAHLKAENTLFSTLERWVLRSSHLTLDGLHKI